MSGAVGISHLLSQMQPIKTFDMSQKKRCLENDQNQEIRVQNISICVPNERCLENEPMGLQRSQSKRSICRTKSPSENREITSKAKHQKYHESLEKKQPPSQRARMCKKFKQIYFHFSKYFYFL